jgi:hypothetical protein
MLGACGTNDDLPLLESMITSDFTKMEPALQQIVSVGRVMRGPLCLPGWYEVLQQRERQKKLGLDALVACYLVLRGGEGLDLIDERFLKDPKVDYTYIYSTIMALRFHGDQNTGKVPKERLLQSIRLLLDNPDFADQVVVDLSRWEDWSVLERLVEMFKTAENKYIRQPVVTYLTVASEVPGDVGRRAAAALADLEQFDPETVKQARSLMAFGALARAKPGGDPAGDNAGAVKERTESPADTAGFAASAADDETDPAEIPDPSDYEESDPQATSTTDQSQAGTTGTQDASDAHKPAVEDAKGVAVVENVTSPKAETSAASTKAAEQKVPEARPILIVGVPLLAAAVLMGVYWAILRIGAV